MAFVPPGWVIKVSEYGRLACGEVSRDAQLVQTKKGGYFVKFSMVAGAKKDGEKLYIDCKAFQPGNVNYCKDLTRGDPILVAGNMGSREYEGKTYWDLNIAWANSPNVVPDMGQAAEAMAASIGSAEPSGDGPQFYEADDDEGELPF